MCTQWIEGVYYAEVEVDTDDFETEADREEFEKDPKGFVEEHIDEFDVDWELDVKNSDSVYARKID